MSTTVAKSVVLVHGTDAFELGEVELAIWEACDGTREIEEIAKKIAARYGESFETVHTDVKDFISSLAEADLIEK